jgi:hypothetical protein
MSYCTNCGQNITDNAKFCPNCGFQISTNTEQIPSPTTNKSEVREKEKGYESNKNTSQKEQYPLQIDNPQNRHTLVCILISFAGFFTATAPFLFDINAFDGGGAMIMIGLTFGITFIFVYFMYKRRAKILDGMINGNTLLIHWKYNDDVWITHAEQTYKEASKGNKQTFNLILIITIVICGILIVASGFEEAMIWVCVGTMGFMGVLKLISLAVPKSQRKSNLKHKGEALVCDEGLWLSGELHTWNGFRNKLKEVKYLEDENVMAFTYRVPNRSTIIQYHTVKVPIPDGEKKEAEKLEAYFYELMHPTKK